MQDKTFKAYIELELQLGNVDRWGVGPAVAGSSQQIHLVDLLLMLFRSLPASLPYMEPQVIVSVSNVLKT
jgi:hypothetical protein